MTRTLMLDNKKIKYTLVRKDVKNINLRIKPDTSIFVSANDSVKVSEIEDFLESKSKYILDTVEHYEEMLHFAPKPKQYVDGESFCIFGHDRRLIVNLGTKNMVTSDESYITLTVKDTQDYELKKRTLNRWLHKECENAIKNICVQVYPKFQKYGVEYPTIRFRNMVSRWGSCQPKRKMMTFNYMLIESSLSDIEYVVTHEFTHFLEANHSKKFYLKLSMFMPDWQIRKNHLDFGKY